MDFHVDFASREPELIVVHERDLANLRRRRDGGSGSCSAPTSRSGWTRCARCTVDVHRAARVAAHGVFGLLNSTPYSAGSGGPGALGVDVLRRMALAALGVG